MAGPLTESVTTEPPRHTLVPVETHITTPWPVGPLPSSSPSIQDAGDMCVVSCPGSPVSPVPAPFAFAPLIAPSSSRTVVSAATRFSPRLNTVDQDEGPVSVLLPKRGDTDTRIARAVVVHSEAVRDTKTEMETARKVNIEDARGSPRVTTLTHRTSPVSLPYRGRRLQVRQGVRGRYVPVNGSLCVLGGSFLSRCLTHTLSLSLSLGRSSKWEQAHHVFFERALALSEEAITCVCDRFVCVFVFCVSVYSVCVSVS